MGETGCEVRTRCTPASLAARGRAAVGVVLWLAVVSACVFGLANSAAVRAGVSGVSAEDQVFAVERAFADTMAERNLDAFGGFLSDEAIFFAGTRPLRGKAAVVEAWSRYYVEPEPPFSWEPDQVEVLDSGTLALSTGPVRDPTGKVVGRFHSIWRLEAPGVWRIVFDKGGPPSPGPGDAPAAPAESGATAADAGA